MFGEEAMFGQTELKIDSKTRLIIPAYTKREEGDKLILVEDTDLNIYRILKQEVATSSYYKTKEELLKTNDPEEEIKLKLELLKLGGKILKKLEVDKQGKVLLGERFKNVEKVNVIGSCDHLILQIKK